LLSNLKKKKRKKQAKKQVIPLSDLINPPNNGEERRGRGKGDNRPYNKKQQKIKVNLAIEDTDSFPALK